MPARMRPACRSSWGGGPGGYGGDWSSMMFARRGRATEIGHQRPLSELHEGDGAVLYQADLVAELLPIDLVYQALWRLPAAEQPEARTRASVPTWPSIQ